jgi:predicted nuclease of predicted toxin-antitoxin system
VNAFNNRFVGPVNFYNIKNKDDNSDMWKKLYMDLKKDKNHYKYVIHMGDQIYLDDAVEEIKLLDAENNDDKIKKIYYSKYKKNYNKKYKKKILGSAFNIMIQDNHDTGINYGDECLSKKMLKYSNLIYVTLQENLYGINNNIIKHLQLDDFQIIIPDIRKYRKSSTTTRQFPIMGKEQIKELNDIISNTPMKIKKTFYVNTLPFLTFNKYIDKLGFIIFSYYLKKELKSDHYVSSDSYMNERKYVINKLFTLNNVIIVAGDKHFADYHILKKNDKKMLHITSSPISSNLASYLNSPSELTNLIAKKSVTVSQKFMYEKKMNNINNITIKRKWMVEDYNYLKVNNGKAMLKCYLKKNNKTICLENNDDDA